MSEKPSQIERDTDLETAMWEPCERYCRDILKRGEITDREYTLIVGNIRGFYSWLKQRERGVGEPTLRITELLLDEKWHTLPAAEQDGRRNYAAKAIEACLQANDLLLKGRTRAFPAEDGTVRVPREPIRYAWRIGGMDAPDEDDITFVTYMDYQELLTYAASKGEKP